MMIAGWRRAFMQTFPRRPVSSAARYMAAVGSCQFRNPSFLADSPHSGMMYPDTVGLASHIRHGNFGEVCTPMPVRPFITKSDEDPSLFCKI
jgi:hypothetical protein